MDGEGDFLKVYIENSTDSDSIEILFNGNELKKIVNSLSKFEDECERFKKRNKDKEKLGFTHLHLKDEGLIDEDSKLDIVLYVNLDE